ncbi:TerC family protein [Gloeobacter morelensis]|uniref:TerC family protein n=1 Tax=Gloeobacter morelensis MG652769 TaxID=2781736 RepID=A0ABY3PNZ7_9CYAN|nr:TerC family protein [Gloeobacter morelensis]UFP95340.1 TerC family protein [Gloeobacter morelensis MG652769]
MEWLSDPNTWISFLTLAVLEIVLGIDNIVFISILAGKLPKEQQASARQIGLLLALGSRILLLFSISWLATLTQPLFGLLGFEFSGRDLILIGGGLFLIGKATFEIHNKLEGEEEHAKVGAAASFASVLIQIMIIDLVFSLDSVITAVGLAERLEVMVAAVVVAVLFMLAFVNIVSDFVDRHPTVKMLALAFLVLIGVNLLADGFGQHIPKGYTYFAMAFSVGVEMLNLRLRGKAAPAPVQLRNTPRDESRTAEAATPGGGGESAP